MKGDKERGDKAILKPETLQTFFLEKLNPE
jgi:hypothetical protein